MRLSAVTPAVTDLVAAAAACTDAVVPTRGNAACYSCGDTTTHFTQERPTMVTPETLAAALRVAQHGARSAMLAARALATDDSQHAAALPEGVAARAAVADSTGRNEPA